MCSLPYKQYFSYLLAINLFFPSLSSPTPEETINWDKSEVIGCEKLYVLQLNAAENIFICSLNCDFHPLLYA